MRYYGTVIRPPSEADSYILQVTYGCSHNRCTFCGTYLDKPFQTRPLEDVQQDVALARRVIPGTRRVFLADGNALVLSSRRLVPILDALAAAFPNLQRVAAYANAQDLLRKRRDELRVLRDKGLRLVYLGLESGHDEVLQRINKGTTAAEMITAHIRYAADNPLVREHLVKQQQEIGRTGDIVTEGRDQGTVAFPHAECKIFLTASPEERARRRVHDLQQRGETPSLDEVLAQQVQRDQRDSSRAVGPLVRAPDAVEVVTDGMSIDEVVERLVEIVEKRR